MLRFWPHLMSEDLPLASERRVNELTAFFNRLCAIKVLHVIINIFLLPFLIKFPPDTAPKANPI